MKKINNDGKSTLFVREWKLAHGWITIQLFFSWNCVFFFFLVNGRTGLLTKQPTKIRAKQPKSSKKVKFISEYKLVSKNTKTNPIGQSLKTLKNPYEKETHTIY